MGDSNLDRKADRELKAIGAILQALRGLDGESIQRVLDYVFSRLSIGRPPGKVGGGVVVGPSAPVGGIGSIGSSRQISIRDLREEKQPESANQMAALVAYYVSEIAPDSERKDTINGADIEKFFKQARFNLPKQLTMALPNATAAGYLDAVGGGMYKLNPVGYNLIAHGLPRAHANATPRRKRATKKTNRR